MQPSIHRQVDIHEYLPVLRAIIDEGKEVSLLITGSSMNPFLVDKRDTIFIRKPQGAFHPGEMVFYQRKNGQYVMHRIHHIDKQGRLFIVGDAQSEIEGPIAPGQVFGEIYAVLRKGKRIEPGSFWWEFFEHVWLHVLPLRRSMMRLYAAIHS